MWSRATKIKVLVGIFAAVALVVGLAIWLAVRSGKLPQATRELVGSTLPEVAEARRELQAELEKIRAAGEPITIEEIIPPEIPDEENAAVLYQKAFDELDLPGNDAVLVSHFLTGKVPPDPDASREEPSGPPPPRRAEGPVSPAEVEAILSRNAAAIELLENAAHLHKCRFPVDWEAGLELTTAHLGQLRRCASMLAAEAILQAGRGEVADALHTAYIGLSMCEALRDEHLWFSQLVRYAIVVIMVDSLRTTLSKQAASTDSCHELFAYLDQMELVDSFTKMLFAERVVSIRFFDEVRENPEGCRDFFDQEDSVTGRFWAQVYAAVWLDKDEAAYLRLVSGRISRLSGPSRYLQVSDENVKQQDEANPEYTDVVEFMLISASFRSCRKRDETIARVGLAQIALALNAYKNEKGEYPESLAQLPEVIEWAELPEDPFSGEDFIYRREGEGFLVYSIGADLEDDGGKAEKDWEEGDIVWRCAK